MTRRRAVEASDPGTDTEDDGRGLDPIARSGVCWALVLLVYVGATRSGWAQREEYRAVRGRWQQEVPGLASRVLDTVSAPALLLSGVVLVLVALMWRRPRLGVGVAVVLVGANVSTQLLKSALAYRAGAGVFSPGVLHGYPSGHATVAMSVAAALVLVAPFPLRRGAAVVATAYAVLVGIGTVTAGWHRPSDVIGGYLVAVAWAMVAVAVGDSDAAPGPDPAPDGRPVREWGTYGFPGLLGLMSLVASITILVAVARHVGLLMLSGRFLGAVAAIVVVGAASIRAIVVALRDC